MEYFGDNSDERLYIDLKDNLGYTSDIERSSRNDSKLTMTTDMKAALAKKRGFECVVIQTASIFICSKKEI